MWNLQIPRRTLFTPWVDHSLLPNSTAMLFWWSQLIDWDTVLLKVAHVRVNVASFLFPSTKANGPKKIVEQETVIDRKGFCPKPKGIICGRVCFSKILAQNLYQLQKPSDILWPKSKKRVVVPSLQEMTDTFSCLLLTSLDVIFIHKWFELVSFYQDELDKLMANLQTLKQRKACSVSTTMASRIAAIQDAFRYITMLFPTLRNVPLGVRGKSRNRPFSWTL